MALHKGRSYPRVSGLLVVGLIFLIGCVTTVRTQQCVASTSTVCSQVVSLGTQVYVPPGLTYDLMLRYSNSFINLLNFAGVQEPRHTYALQLICGTWLRPCHKEGNVTLTVPEQPCLDMCWTYYNACVNVYPFFPPSPTLPIGIGFYYPAGFPPLNCSAPPIDPFAGNVTFYPASDTLVSYNSLNYTIPCSQEVPLVPPAATICTSPLVPSTGRNGAAACAFSCPLPSLSDNQYKNVKILQGIVGWFSWATTAVLIVFLLVYPKSRDFPRNMVIMTACAANIAAGAIILPTYAGYDETWCGGSDTTLTPSGDITGLDIYGLPIVNWNIDETFLAIESSLCTFQGAMLQFGFLAAVFWWLLIAFNMCLELYFGKMLSLELTKWKWIRFGIYNLFGWGLAFILMVIPASAGRIKFVPAGTYCFVTNEDNYAWSLTFWFLPVGISLILGVLLFLAAIIRVTILFITIKKVMKLLLLYTRLFIFIFLYLTMIVFITAYNIQVANDKNSINDGYRKYYDCLIVGVSECHLSDSISNYDLVMLKAWAISSLGVLLFFIFFSWDGIKFWGLLFKAIALAIWTRKTQDFLGVLQLVTYKSAKTSLHTSGSGSLTVTGGIPDEEDEDEDELDKISGEESSSKSSEEEEGASVSSSSEE